MAGRNRSRGRRTQPKNNRVAGWQWVLSVALVLLFAAFLFFLRNVSPSVSETVALKPRAAAETRVRTAKKQSTATKKPRFEFYTILPKKEGAASTHRVAPKARKSASVEVKKSKTPSTVVGPAQKPQESAFDKAIPTKAKPGRMEADIGKQPEVSKSTTRYILQAGAFRTMKDADERKAVMALMGLEGRVEKATVKGVIWYRVKLGPFSSRSQADSIRSQLKQSRVDSVVLKDRS